MAAVSGGASVVIRPVLGHQEMQAVIGNLGALYAMANEKGPERKAQDFAARCIGETLGACGGWDLMQFVFGMFEDAHGPRWASWLDHRWDGIEIAGGGHWIA